MIVGEYYTLSEGGFTPPPPHHQYCPEERDIGVSIRWRVNSWCHCANDCHLQLC